MTLKLNIFNTFKQPRYEEDMYEVDLTEHLFKNNSTKQVF